MSPETCKVCMSDHREEIDAALADGSPGRLIARRFGLAEASVRRHRQNHVEDGEILDAGESPEKEPETVEEAARRRLAEDEALGADAKLRRYSLEEERRREREREEAVRERRREQARERAEKLRRELCELSQRAEEEMVAAVRTLNEYAAVREKLQREMSVGFPGYRWNNDPLPWMIQRFIGDRLQQYAPGGRKEYAYAGQTLAQQDPLIPDSVREALGA